MLFYYNTIFYKIKLYRLQKKRRKSITKIKLLTKSLFPAAVPKQVRKPVETEEEQDTEVISSPYVSYVKYQKYFKH